MIVLSFLVKRFQAHCCQRRLLKHHSTYSATSFNCSIDSCWFKTKNIFFETKHEKTFHVLDSFLKLNRGVLFWWQTDRQTDRQTDQVDFFFWFWIRPGLRPESQLRCDTHQLDSGRRCTLQYSENFKYPKTNFNCIGGKFNTWENILKIKLCQEYIYPMFNEHWHSKTSRIFLRFWVKRFWV